MLLNTRMNRPLLLLILILSFTFANAQVTSQFGTIPSININTKFQKDWSANFKAESRFFFDTDKSHFDYRLTDISAIIAKRLAINISGGVGYLMRFEEGEIENRTIQQLSLVKRYPSFRIAHRFLSDQTFSRNNNTEYRLRYRLSAEIPLEGQTIDENEFYLKLSNEFLNSWENNEYDLEIRGVSLIGYSISARNDIELGIDYRTDSFIQGNQRNRYLLSINFFQSLGR